MRHYNVETADIKLNKHNILSVLTQNLAGVSENQFRWKYEDCPNGKSRCWLVRDEETNNFVGSGSLFMRKIFVDGKPVSCAVAGDFAIHKEHRSGGPAIMLQRIVKSNINEDGIVFIYGFPNKLSEAIFLRIGYVEIGRMARFVKMLRADYKLKEYLRNTYISALFFNISNFIHFLFSKETYHKKPHGLHIEMPQAFDERFDALWEKTKTASRVIGERTAKFLNWRYIQFPAKNYRIFTLKTGEEAIIGYIVFHIKDNFCYILDVLCLDFGFHFNFLLLEFIKYMRKERVYSISISCVRSKLLSAKLKKCGFHFRQEEEKIVVAYNDPQLKHFLEQEENWYLFEGDNDV